MMGVLLVYVPCSNKEEAERIGSALLAERIVACVNIVPSTCSLYLWPPGSGKQEQSDETLLIAKTIEEKWDAVEQTVARFHSYATPCVLGIPVPFVSRAYGEWVASEVRGGQ